MNRFPWVIFLSTGAFFAADMYLTLITPPNSTSARLGLSGELPRIALSVSFILPIFLSFFYGFWASKLLFKGQFRFFAIGVFILSLILLVGTILGQIRTRLFPNDVQMSGIITLITNYIYVFGYLGSFYVLISGIRNFLGRIKLENILVSILVAILIVVPYGILLFTNPDRLVKNDPLLFITILVPTAVSWFLAILVAFSLPDIHIMPADSLKQKGLRKFIAGIIFIIFSAIILEAILSIGTTRFIAGGLVLILVIIYLFVFALAIGNFLVWQGADKLAENP